MPNLASRTRTMSLEGLLELYINSDNTSRLLEKLKSQGKSRVSLKGMVGSAPPFVLAAVSKGLQKVHLCILPNQETAAYFLNDLENICGKEAVLYFPASGRKPYEEGPADNSSILLRAEVLSSLLHYSDNDANKHKVIVTYPEALSEKVVTKSHLLKNTLEVRKGEKLSVEFVVEILLEYGFERADYVIEPGQFSVRGGIIDLFSFSNDFPYRVELSGDEVESIRSFNTVDQLSIEQHDTITVLPNIQTRLLREHQQSFLEYIPSDSVIWIKEAELFTDKEQFLNQLENFSIVELGNRFYFNAALVLEYRMSQQPVFNKNFDLLIENLNENERAGFRNILFSDTEKQVERLRSILDERAAFTPIHLSIHEGFTDHQLKVACYTDHQVFGRYHRFQVKNVFSKTNEAITLKEIKGLNPGDYITHIDHGVGRYGGLEKMEVNGKLQEAIRLVYKDNDILYVSIHSLHRIAKYSSKEGAVPKLDKLGSAAWQNLKQKTKKKVKEIAFDLIRLYAERKAKKGFAFAPDNYLQNEMEASFIYEDTPDQLKATKDVKKDMEESAPMDRLVCGDVGFGKTEIAIRAAFKAALDGKQVAVLVPTTILALQHYKTFSERLSRMPCTET